MDVLGAVVNAAHITKRCVEYWKGFKEAPEDIARILDQIGQMETAMGQIKKLCDQLGPLQQEDPHFKKARDEIDERSRMIVTRLDRISEIFDEKDRKPSSFKRLMWPLKKDAVRHEMAAIREFLYLLGLFSNMLSIQVLETNLTRLQMGFKAGVTDLKAAIITDDDETRFENAIAWLNPKEGEFHSKLVRELNKCESSPPWAGQNPKYNAWISNSSSESPLCYAFGSAGTGKTCLASFVANSLRPGCDALVRNPRKFPEKDHWAVSGTPAPRKSTPAPSETELLASKTSASDPSAMGMAVALFYCDHQNQSGQDPDSILKSLSGQLLQSLHYINPWKARRRLSLVEKLRNPLSHPWRPNSVLNSFADSFTGQSAEAFAVSSSESFNERPTALSLFETLVGDLEQSYVVIDALDENPEHWFDLIEALKKVFTSSTLKVFVTSRGRGYTEMESTAERLGAIKLQICPDRDEIYSFVESELNLIADGKTVGGGTALYNAVQAEPERRRIANLVVDSSVDAHDGNFLCAELQMKMLLKATGRTHLERQLENLPEGLHRVFNEAFQRIQAADGRGAHPKMGQRALLWTVYSERPLKFAELSHAIQTYHVSHRIEERDKHELTPQMLVESTCYFLNIDSATSTIRVHKGVKEFCEGVLPAGNESFFSDPHREMAEICLKYLTLENFSSGYCNRPCDFERRLEYMPLLRYAASHLGYHARRCGGRTRGVFMFLDDRPTRNNLRILLRHNYISSLGQALRHELDRGAREFHDGDFCPHSHVGQSGGTILPQLHLLTFYDFTEYAEELLEGSRIPRSEIEGLSCSRVTVLWLASRLGRARMVEVLLDHGADPAVASLRNQHCLSVAAHFGHLSVVKLLVPEEEGLSLRNQKLLHQYNRFGRSVLTDAAIPGHYEILEYLLQQTAKLNPRSDILLKQEQNGNNILHDCIPGGDEEVLQLLLQQPEAKMLLMQRNCRQATPLHDAISLGKESTAEKLLEIEREEQLAQCQGQDRTPLLHAIEALEYHHSPQLALNMIDLLLRYGADLNVRDVYQGTVLHLAAFHGQPAIIRRLLQDARSHTLLEIKDVRGLTPLGIAWKDRRNHWEASIALLSEAGASQPRCLTTSSSKHLTSSSSALRWFAEDIYGFYRQSSSPDSLDRLPIGRVESERDYVYLESNEILESVKTPILRIVFRLKSHDQGYAKPSPDDEAGLSDTYGSWTWFEVARCNGSMSRSIFLTSNKRANMRFQEQEISWDVDHGELGDRRFEWGDAGEEEVREFLRSLRPGDRVLLLAKARFPGWVNYVHHAEISIFYLD